jgi:carboxymethylenebutenolidase
MCFDPDSHPPIDPIAGGALDAGPVLLSGRDGTSFRAYAARPAQPTGAGIVILPDVRGLHPFFEELALRFAEHGIAAVAIDYYARTAGTGVRAADFDYQPHLAEVHWDGLSSDIEAGAAHLGGPEVGSPRSKFVTGFCMGGRLASLATTLGLGFSGAVAFYGFPVGPNRSGSPAPVDVADKIECDVLAIYGGADQAITPEMRDAYDLALEAAGVGHRTLVYPGAPHSFFDRKADEFADASASAWSEMLAFIRDRTA